MLNRSIFRFEVELFPNQTVNRIATVTVNGTVPSQFDPSLTPFFVPLLQATPAAEWIFGLMGDARTTPDRAFRYDTAFATRAPAWSGLTISGTDAQHAATKLRVSSYIVVPSVFTDYAANTSRVTGFIFATFSYDDIIRSFAQPSTFVDIVIRDLDRRELSYGGSYGSALTSPTEFSAYTLRVRDGRVENVGRGDAHSRSAVSEQYAQSITVRRGASSTFAFDIYPSDEYLALLTDDGPVEWLALFTGIVFGVFAFFLLFDFLSRGHFRTHSTALTVEKVQAELGQEHLKQQQLFAGMVAGEIRAPAAAICAALADLQQAEREEGGGALPPAQRVQLAVIDQCTAEIAALVRGWAAAAGLYLVVW